MSTSTLGPDASCHAGGSCARSIQIGAATASPLMVDTPSWSISGAACPMATMKILHLFPDTNVFVQCRALHDLDWSTYARYDEVRLIVCMPVQREIDRHKARGNDRLGRRSRKAHSVFRDLIIGGDAYKVVREREPVVKLLLDPSCQPDPVLAERLDYGHTDDCIVGCVYGYRKRYPKWDIRLLTHDSGPMATARMVSVPFVSVPDGWLRPPEPTDAERDNKRLREEIADLKSAEPRFSISHTNGDGKEIDLLEFKWPSFEGLSAEEVDSLVESLKREFPVATEFGPDETQREQLRTVGAALRNSIMRFEPPSQKEIDQYTKIAHPQWIERCEQILRGLHSALECNREPIVFSFSATNEGSRPGKQVLLKITARGNFLVRPPREDDDGVEDTMEETWAHGLSLPSPPTPPKGEWTTGYGYSSPLFRHMQGVDSTIRVTSGSLDLSLARNLDSLTMRRDPNAFYYKPNCSRSPSQSFSLECEQWRHGMATELFDGELWVEPDTPEISGVLEFEIHASNLHRPAKKIVRVKGQTKPFDVNTFAQSMIRSMTQRA